MEFAAQKKQEKIYLNGEQFIFKMTFIFYASQSKYT